MQYSLDKDLQHLKWQQLRSWISSPDCLFAMGQAADAVFSVYPSKNGRCSQIIENSKIAVSRHLDSSTTTQMAWIMVQCEKIQSFLLKGICTVILWQDYCGKGNLRILLKHGWEKIPNWECLFVHREKGFFLSVYVDDIKLAGRETKYWSRCGNYSIKKSIWKNQHLSWIMVTWDTLNDNAK